MSASTPIEVLAIDPSLTSSGFAYQDGDEIVTGRIKPGKRRGVERLLFIRQCVDDLITKTKAGFFVMEGYAMGKARQQGGLGRFFDIGELGGTLKLLAIERGLTIILVPPGSLKKFATGKGNADKAAVRQAVLDQWGQWLKSDDEADAYALLRYGRAKTRRIEARRYPATQRGALEGSELIAYSLQ